MMYSPTHKRGTLGVSSLKIPLLLCQELRLCAASPTCDTPELALLCVHTSALPPLNPAGLMITSPPPSSGDLQKTTCTLDTDQLYCHPGWQMGA